MQYGLIGEKLGHSFSKEIHGKIKSYKYELKEIAKKDLASFMTEKNFLGINVTIPYKSAVIPFLDEISPRAKKIGAVNTVVNVGGKLYGYNTDYLGIEGIIEKSGISVKGKTVHVLGTGGTSKTATAVLEDLGAKKIIKVSRTATDGVIDYDTLYSGADGVKIIVNTTPVGMYPNNEKTPVDIDRFANLEGVIDVIYNPINTALITKAKERKIKCQGGLYMLVAQAVYSAGYFTFEKPASSLIDSVYEQILKEKSNIVLTGMPSCGKSTVGKILSSLAGKEFIDTDEIITERYNSPSKVIETDGEARFREIETEIIKEVSKLGGKIISTGGGAVLKQENITALKQNGVIFFINRPLEKLIATPDRPLSSSIEALKKRYEERYGVYTSTCDFIINADCTPEEVANKVLKEF